MLADYLTTDLMANFVIVSRALPPLEGNGDRQGRLRAGLEPDLHTRRSLAN